MAEDIVTYGRRPPGSDEAFESLFYARYPPLVQAALRLAGDWAVAGHLAQEAFARLWRRRRRIRDPDAAAAYLHEAVTRLANSAGWKPGAASAGRDLGAASAGWKPGPAPGAEPPEQSRHRIDVDEAWREFQRRRQQAARRGNRWLAITAAVVVVIAAAAALAGWPHNGHAVVLPSAGTSPG